MTHNALCGWTGRETITFIILKESIANTHTHTHTHTSKRNSLEIKGKYIDINPAPLHLWPQLKHDATSALKKKKFVIYGVKN